MDCIFCEIVDGVRESYKVYEDDSLLIILDKYPVSRGHLLVIPKDHYYTLDDVPNNVLSRLWIAASSAAKIYRRELNAPGVNVVTNVGSQAGQVIFHFHIHVIPRWGGYHGFWSGRHALTEEEAQEVLEMWNSVREKFLSLLGG